jgi:hypothetical protein
VILHVVGGNPFMTITFSFGGDRIATA